ncbi:MAG: transposase [Actinomycetota bacterium]|nr:transposase [Actinomycetota bacterium]
MTTLADKITAGVDTHLDVHVAAALNAVGGLLGVESFPADGAGYRRLLSWLQSFGAVVLVGVEGTGSYGAGLTRHLQAKGVAVVEVDRPNRQGAPTGRQVGPPRRHRGGPSGAVGTAKGSPKTRNGSVEAIRVLRVARSSARKDRVRALNELRSLISTAPEELRAELRGLSIFKLVNKAAGLRPNGRTDVTNATKLAMRSLARRVRDIDAEVAEIDAVLGPLVAETAPDLITLNGVGTDTAGALLVAAGDNPDRLRNEATFARLCGVAPLDASSGKQQRHRLNRGGDRQANAALWRIVLVRLRWDPKTKAYLERRCKEGLTKPEAIRCLKRYVAREVFYYLVPLQAA